MKKFLFLVFLAVGLCAGAVSPRAGVSILGDSYSTFEGHMQPDTNLVWYHAVPDLKHTDVTDVKQTWWQQLIRQKGWRLAAMTARIIQTALSSLAPKISARLT